MPSTASFKGRPRPIVDKISRPVHEQHVGLLAPQFAILEKYLDSDMSLRAMTDGSAPEEVLVLETIGTVEQFITAVRRIDGLELLGEWDDLDIPPDDNFFRQSKDGHKLAQAQLNGRLFLVMTNQRAMAELLSYWKKYELNPSIQFDKGKAKLREVFQKLKTVRRWGPQDRLVERGGIDVWTNELVADPDGTVIVQIELWFRETVRAREVSSNSVRGALSDCGAEILDEYVLEEIRYHAFLVKLSPLRIAELIKMKPIKLLQHDQVMYIRASAQHIISKQEEYSNTDAGVRDESISGLPLVALLDGFPLANHNLLTNRLIVDDPDNYGEKYSASNCKHGTAMASLILHGDLDAKEQSLKSPLYVRPILQPCSGGEGEQIPSEILPVRLLLEAISRIFENDEESSARAPSVRVLNLSVCDQGRPFDFYPSPLARLIDWLSDRYNVLFVVSAGNCLQDVYLTPSRSSESTKEAILSIASDLRNRRLLSPAESINAVTVGALHHNESVQHPVGDVIDLIAEEGLASPASALGFGFQRAIKPDIFASGGRQFFKKSAIDKKLSICDSGRFGQLVACPSGIGGDTARTTRIRGTSGAAALTTRRAELLIQYLQRLSESSEFSSLTTEFYPVLVKAMLVHGAKWSSGFDVYRQALEVPANVLREHVSRFLGYGSIASELLTYATDERATLLGWGEISAEEEQVFTIPLPASLSAKKIWRRLIITLAWNSPVNAGHRAYRQAALSFEPPHLGLRVHRQNADWQAVRRGTVQHEVLEGEEVIAFKRGDALSLKVLCQKRAGELNRKIRYGIAVTLEVSEDQKLPIWQDINDILIEIRQKLSVQARTKAI